MSRRAMSARQRDAEAAERDRWGDGASAAAILAEQQPRARCPVCDLPHVPTDRSGRTWGPDCACQGAGS